MLLKRILPLFCVLLLCGCSQSRAVTPILSNISFSAEIEYLNEKYLCDALVGNNDMKITVVEPKEISGLSYTLNNGEITAEYLGIKYSPDTNKALSSNVAVILNGIFDRVKNNELKVISNGDNCTVKGEFEDESFVFEFSPQGLPLKLSVEDRIIIHFKNVTIK